MIVGILSDAHGNPGGLIACLDALKRAGADHLYFLGDSLGYLPEAGAVLSALRTHGVACLRGNHEEMLLGRLALDERTDEVYGIRETRTRLADEDLEWIERWPVQLDVALHGLRLRLLHGSPADPITGYLHEDTMLDLADDPGFDVLFCGHTHRPYVRSIGKTTIVNVGSCGLPRDVGHLASCATFDTHSRQADIVRVPFDAEALIRRHGAAVHPTVVDVLRRGSNSRGEGEPRA